MTMRNDTLRKMFVAKRDAAQAELDHSNEQIALIDKCSASIQNAKSAKAKIEEEE